jgi:UDP-3-O-[3-hydroxymyristoyl] N-acetylglucosamine deacetylase
LSPIRPTSLSPELQFEHTIESPLAFNGIGLHSGAQVSLRLVPAPAGSGIVFRRSDLDSFEIPATGRNVARVSYATSLMRQGVLISTTEHLLSALIGLGVDNLIIEIDNLEVPILDGSARPYVDAILAAGRKRQRRKREYIRILKPIEVHENSASGSHSTRKFIGLYPGDGYQIDYSIDFPSPIRGASPESAIILSRNGVENGPLRFADEFVRHKVLDLIGDLALAGRRIWGRVVAERAGHAMHTALVQRLLRDRSAWEFAHRAQLEEITSDSVSTLQVSAA